MSTNSKKNTIRQGVPTLEGIDFSATLTAVYEGNNVQCTIESPVMLIGGRRDCHLSLAHPDISKLHTAIFHSGSGLFVCDLRSRSGTFVNGEAIDAAPLRPGDELRVGPININVEFENIPEPLDDSLEIETPISLAAGNNTISVKTVGAIIGRRNTCEIVVDDPDASLVHTLLFIFQNHLTAFDLGSRSGTQINGEICDLRYLNPGDTLSVSGHEFVVSPELVGQETEPELEDVDMQKAHPANIPTTPMTDDDLEDFERVIAALQSHLATAHTRLDERLVELRAHKSDLEGKEAALTAQSEQFESEIRERQTQLESELTQRREALESELNERTSAFDTQMHERETEFEKLKTEQSSEIEQLRDEIVADREKLQAEMAEFEQQRQSIADERIAIEAAVAECETTKMQLEQREQELNSTADQLQEQRQTLDARDAEISERNESLDSREAVLQAREHALELREAEHIEAAKKVEHFKAALKQATQAFASYAAPMPTSAPSEASAGPSQEQNASTPEIPPEVVDEQENPLPAPMVTEPLFAGPPRQRHPAQDAAKAMRDRLRAKMSDSESETGPDQNYAN